MRQKLHSRRGASMLIALLFFLVAMTVGAVVLTAASANAGRVVRSRQEQQNYLAAASAAELVKEDIAGEPCLTFTGFYRRIDTETVTSHQSTDPDGTVHTWTTTEHRTEYREDADPLSGDSTGLNGSSLLVIDQAMSLNDVYYATVPELSHGAPAQDMEKTLAFQENAALGIPAVEGKLTIRTDGNERYTIRVRLEGRRDGNSANGMTMVFAPKVSEPEASVETKSWTAGDSYITAVTTTYKTTVTWEAPVITKGAEP